jgi:membrane protease YdiL (CAAX protease family)
MVALGGRSTPDRRSLSYTGFAVIVVVYLAIIQGSGLLLQHTVLDGADDFHSTRNVIVGMWVPLGLALLFTYAVVTWLRWWRPVLHDDRPVRAWVAVVPIVFVVGILLAIDYAGLADKGVGYALALVVGTQLVGWGEEGMFRGLGVTMLRDHALREGQVALWSSVIFGAVHLSNAIGHGVRAVPQAIVVSLAGYFFYLVRRRTRGNVANSVIHGFFDFSLLSGTAIAADQELYPGALAAILVYPVLAVVLLVRRHHIEPDQRTGVASLA